MALLRKPNRLKTLRIRHPWESRFKSAGNRFSTLVQVAALAEAAVKVEIDAIAHIGAVRR